MTKKNEKNLSKNDKIMARFDKIAFPTSHQLRTYHFIYVR